MNLGIANANREESRAIIHSFGIKLRALMLGEETEITFCDAQGTKKKYKFTDEERLSFVLFGILYASRCNNFHGNVAARMNSINANRDTFRMYTDMFLTEYIILAIHITTLKNDTAAAVGFEFDCGKDHFRYLYSTGALEKQSQDKIWVVE